MRAAAEHFFLYRVARDLWERWGAEGLRHSMVFLPSSRSKLFFVRYLHELAGKQALVLPAWTSVRSEAERISGIEVVEPLLLLPEVFHSYQELNKASLQDKEISDAFDEFYPAGMTILHDFDQIDKYLVNAHELFENIQATSELSRRIDFLTEEQRQWLEKFFTRVGSTPRSQLEQRYLDIWQLLGSIYERLQSYILERKEGYEGAVLRHALQKIEDSPSLVCNENVQHYAVVGFNALSACEEKYFEYLKNGVGKENVLFYWDFPATLNRQEQSETKRKDAGYFIRMHRTLGDALPEAEPSNTAQTVEIIAAPSVLSQADVVRDILEKQTKEAIENSVLILPDEQLLMPVLQALPQNISANITMGYSLRNTLVYLLLENLLAWLASRTEAEKSSSRKSLKTLLLHPFWQNEEEVKHALKVLESDTNDKIADTKLEGVTSLVTNWIRSFEKNTLGEFLLEFLHKLGERLEAIYEAEKKEEKETECPIWMHHISAAYEVISALNQVVLRANISSSVRLYRMLLPQLFRDKKIFYYGEPLAGLQIMGFLETRCLDFEEVTILSCNEGSLPALHVTPSFIMSSLSRGYNLPTLQDRELMYAYYFQTIVARARHVRLICAKTDGAGVGTEPSRYLLQKKYPLGNEDVTNTARLTTLDYSFSPREEESNNTAQHPVQVPIENCKAEFEAYCAQGISPSALSSYCRCPLLFYYKYIARIEERKEPERAELSALTFGTWVHNSLQALYKPLCGEDFSEEKRQERVGAVDEVVKSQYGKIKGGSDIRGIELIESTIVSKVLQDCLAFDVQRTPFKLCALEYNIKGEIELEGGKKVLLQGTIDRIDKEGDNFRIIDYKTGQYDKKHVTLTSVDSLLDGSEERDYVFQTFFYAYLLEQVPSALSVYNGNKPLTPLQTVPSLWFVMEGEKAKLELLYPKKPTTHSGEVNAPSTKEQGVQSYAAYAADFKAALRNTLSAMLATKSFAPTDDTKRCEKCAYQVLCWGAKGI